MPRGILKKEEAKASSSFRKVRWSEDALVELKYYDPSESLLLSFHEKVVSETDESNDGESSWLNLMVGAAGVGFFRVSRRYSAFFNVLCVGGVVSIAVWQSLSAYLNQEDEEVLARRLG